MLKYTFHTVDVHIHPINRCTLRRKIERPLNSQLIAGLLSNRHGVARFYLVRRDIGHLPVNEDDL